MTKNSDFDVKISSHKELVSWVQSQKQLWMTKNIVFIDGDLGAGKTELTKQIILSLESGQLPKEFGSPTYNLIHEYPGQSKKYLHIDLYRMESFEELESSGVLESLEENQTENNLAFVEWSNKFSYLRGLFKNSLHVQIERADRDEGRRIRGLNLNPQR